MHDTYLLNLKIYINFNIFRTNILKNYFKYKMPLKTYKCGVKIYFIKKNNKNF